MFLGGSCIEWPGTRTERGYGIKRIGKKRVKVHRLAWAAAHAPIPTGMMVLHHCDNPPCYRLDHLFLGTAADNTADMIAKGRAKSPGPSRGERHPQARTPDALVSEVVDLVRSGVSQAEAGRRYGVPNQTVSNWVNGVSRR